MQDIDQFKATFFQECDELLVQLERHTSEMSGVDQPAEALNAAFRAIHSIKGGAGMFGFSRLVAFAHALESALDQARSGRIETNPAFIEAVLHATDTLSDLATAARTGNSLPVDYETARRDQLTLLVGVGLRSSNTAQPQNDDRQQLREVGSEAGHNMDTYRIRYEPAPDIFRRGLEPLLFVRNLAELGRLEVAADVSKIPGFLESDPAIAYMSWTFELETRAPKKSIFDVFEFISGACRLDVELVATPAPSASAQPQDAALLTGGDTPAAPDARLATSIRVDLERVERLVNLVGEISIAQSMVLQHLEQSIVDSNPQLFRALTQLLQLSRGLQDGVMTIRAQPIRSIFSRMPRVVRDAAQLTNKTAHLALSGEDTEIDKAIIEQISDPLMHIVRNAIDHGIESADVRREAGKPEAGLVTLSAAQRGGRIVVEVSDDGRGIDRAAVRQRAIDLNLIADDITLSEYEIDNLVFRAGLSTALSVSNLSGRGVGMDVVYRNIQKLGGRVSIRSEPGAGTTTSIILPLTLAVLDAMLIRSGPEKYLIPLANIIECIVVGKPEVNCVPGAGDFVAVRGRQMRVLDLADRLQKTPAPKSTRLQIVLVEIQNGGVVGLIVDEICGHRQVVIKSVREHFHHIPGIAGATILGDGQVAFILDADEVAAIHTNRGRETSVTKHIANEEACAA